VFDIVELISQTVVLPGWFVNKFLWDGPPAAVMFGRHQHLAAHFVCGTQVMSSANALIFAPMSNSRVAIIGITLGGPQT